MELHVERQSFALGRHGQSAKGIALPVLVAPRTDGGLSLGGPGALEVGDKQKAACLQEHQRGSTVGGLFLSGATRRASHTQSRARSVAGHAGGVSGNSTPALAAEASSHAEDSVHGIGASLPWQYALKSITRFDTRWPVRLEARWWPSAPSPRGTERKADRDSGARATPLARAVCRCVPIARQNFLMRRACGLLPKEICGRSRRGWRGDAVSPIAHRLLEVSCSQA
jgi:hypothetical protein